MVAWVRTTSKATGLDPIGPAPNGASGALHLLRTLRPGSVLETNLGPRPVYEMISLLTLSLVLPSFFTPTLICLLYIYLHGYTHSQGCRLQLSLTFSISSSINSATGATTHPPHLCPHVSPPPHRLVAVSGPFHACTSLPR
jgi:hypothetical protein